MVGPLGEDAEGEGGGGRARGTGSWGRGLEGQAVGEREGPRGTGREGGGG